MTTDAHVSVADRFAIIPEWVLFHEQLTPLDVRLYGRLRRIGDYEVAEAEVSRGHLAGLFGVTRKTIDRALKRLEDAGAVEVERGRIQGKVQLPNLYKIITACPVRPGDIDDPRDTDDPGDIPGPRATDDAPPGPQMSHKDRESSSRENPPTPASGGVAGSADRQPATPPAPTPAARPATGRPAKRIRPGEDGDPLWERFWEAYPAKVSKGAARKAWRATINRRPKVDPEHVIAAAARYRDNPERDRRYTANPATWLNAEKYADEGIEGHDRPAREQGFTPGMRFN